LRYLPSFPTRRSSDLQQFLDVTCRAVLLDLHWESLAPSIESSVSLDACVQRVRNCVLDALKGARAGAPPGRRSSRCLPVPPHRGDRKSTRLNSSHVKI